MKMNVDSKLKLRWFSRVTMRKTEGERSHAGNSQCSRVQLEGTEAGCWFGSLLAHSRGKNGWTTLVKEDYECVWCFCLWGRLMRARTGLCASVHARVFSTWKLLTWWQREAGSHKLKGCLRLNFRGHVFRWVSVAALLARCRFCVSHTS